MVEVLACLTLQYTSPLCRSIRPVTMHPIDPPPLTSQDYSVCKTPNLILISRISYCSLISGNREPNGRNGRFTPDPRCGTDVAASLTYYVKWGMGWARADGGMMG